MQKWTKHWDVDQFAKKSQKFAYIFSPWGDKKNTTKIPQQLYNKVLSLEFLSFFYVNFYYYEAFSDLATWKIKLPNKPSFVWLSSSKGIPHTHTCIWKHTHTLGFSGRHAGANQSLNVTVLYPSYVEVSKFIAKNRCISFPVNLPATVCVEYERYHSDIRSYPVHPKPFHFSLSHSSFQG